MTLQWFTLQWFLKDKWVAMDSDLKCMIPLASFLLMILYGSLVFPLLFIVWGTFFSFNLIALLDWYKLLFIGSLRKNIIYFISYFYNSIWNNAPGNEIRKALCATLLSQNLQLKLYLFKLVITGIKNQTSKSKLNIKNWFNVTGSVAPYWMAVELRNTCDPKLGSLGS